jgi:hypothetical protein
MWGNQAVTSLAEYMTLCVMATKENKIHIERENGQGDAGE